MPSKKKKYNARFPAGRIKRIMQTDEEVGKVAQAVPVIISRTLELFVESLLTKSYEVTLARNAKTLSPSHVKLCISAESRFDFLKDLVKNIPDISQAEEKEAGQSADSSPTACRFPEIPPGPSTPVLSPGRPPIVRHPHGYNGRSGDSAPDCESAGKRLYNPNRPPELCNNGRDPMRYPAVGHDSVAHVSDNDSIHTPTGSVQNTSLRENRPNRLPNFYTETLSTVDDEDPPPHDSVIRPNPDYSPQNLYAFQKQTDNYDRNMIPKSMSTSETRPPELRLDLTKGFARSASADSVAPVFHLDLSAVTFPLTHAENKTGGDSPFTPSLIWQPKTPHLEGNFFPDSSKKLDASRRAPPPLLKRSLSDAVKLPATVRMPPLATISPVSSFLRSDSDKVDNPSPPSRSTGKRKKSNFSNEPPPLLPIVPTQKVASTAFRKGESVEMQLDEDYDT